MKKRIAVILALVLVLARAACGRPANTTPSNNTTPANNTTP